MYTATVHIMLQGSKVTRKRTARACVRPCKRNKTTEQSTHNEIDSILQEYQEKAQDMNPDSSATSVWLALNVVQYEETFMRECIYEEDKPCSMGQYCECNFIDVTNLGGLLTNQERDLIKN